MNKYTNSKFEAGNPKQTLMSKQKYEISKKLALHYSKYFFDHSKVRFTANPKLTFQAQTLNLRPFRITKNGYRKNLNSRSELPFQRSQHAKLRSLEFWYSNFGFV